jgi:hypothetical protein
MNPPSTLQNVDSSPLRGAGFLEVVCASKKEKKIMPLLRFDVLTAVIMKKFIFWDITPCSPLKVKRRFGETYRIHCQGRRISQAKYERGNSACHLLSCWFRPPKMDATCSSETSVDFKQTTWRYIPRDRTLQEPLLLDIFFIRL